MTAESAIYSDIIPRSAEYGVLVFFLVCAVVALGAGGVFLTRYIIKTMTEVISNNTKAWTEAKGVLDEIRKGH